ncbi:hypothetical protein PR202_gb25512 [Eleusine coracana subsp. coracana]|uniref:Uncharacterized protein n=1 Tax=Eleusine coracana subsp. coracana TaxID=191504 RepID=A0AAV5FP58_ELECO|nr:hypothetical protein PR202_gb25512 [Eleusine coracana subsp. coracana]
MYLGGVDLLLHAWRVARQREQDPSLQVSALTAAVHELASEESFRRRQGMASFGVSGQYCSCSTPVAWCAHGAMVIEARSHGCPQGTKVQVQSCHLQQISICGSLALDLIEQAEVEVQRLDQLKYSKMKEIAFKKQTELEDIYAGAHIIAKAKEEALSRKDILDKVERWMSASLHVKKKSGLRITIGYSIIGDFKAGLPAPDGACTEVTIGDGCRHGVTIVTPECRLHESISKEDISMLSIYARPAQTSANGFPFAPACVFSSSSSDSLKFAFDDWFAKEKTLKGNIRGKQTNYGLDWALRSTEARSSVGSVER